MESGFPVKCHCGVIGIMHKVQLSERVFKDNKAVINVGLVAQRVHVPLSHLERKEIIIHKIDKLSHVSVTADYLPPLIRCFTSLTK